MAFRWIGKSQDGKTITLNRLESHHFNFPTYFTPEWEKTHADDVRVGAVLDVETSGFSSQFDKIIEIGIRQFKFNRLTGELLQLMEHYTGFQDPGFQLSEEIKALTGITDEMLKNQKLNMERINSLLDSSQLIIAHNASFDRPFVDKISDISRERIWGCSFKQIHWNTKGFPSQKLEILSIYHGFFNENHRALSDSDSLLYLLSLPDASSEKPYLFELIENARKPTLTIYAHYAPFERKDFLKARGYKWDTQTRVWSKKITHEQSSDEVKWLELEIYCGPFKGTAIETQPMDHFKSDQNPR